MRTAARAVSLSLVLVSSAGFGLRAQSLPQPLTLEEAIRIAEANSPDYRVAMNALDRSRVSEQRTFRATFFPQIMPTLNFSGNSYRTYTAENFDGSLLEEPQIHEGRSSRSSQSVSVSMTLFSGANLMRYLQSRAQADQTEAQVDANVLAVRADVKRRFYGALQTEAAVEVEERLVARATDNLDVVERRFGVGASQLEDVLSARVELQRSEAAVERARGEAYKARMELLEGMGVDASADFELAGTLPEPFDPGLLDPDAWVAIALESSPRMRQANAALRASSADTRAARAQRWPTLRASASWSRTRTAGDFDAIFELNPQNSDYSVNLSLQVPIPLLRFDENAQIALADLSLADAEEGLRRERMAVENDVRAAIVDLQTAYRNVRMAESEAELRREQVEIVEVRFEAGGSVDYLRLEQIWDQAAQAERAVLNARIAFQSALLALEQLVGREVTP